MKTIDSKHSRGPARWERARGNAKAHPDSFGARLYNARVRAARDIEKNLVLNEGPRIFYGIDRSTWYFKDKIYYDGIPSDAKRLYYTCSIRCTSLQAALDFGSVILMDKDDQTSIDWEELSFYVKGAYTGHSRGIAEGHPINTARCQVCAAAIHPDGTVAQRSVKVELPPVKEPEGMTHTFYVDVTTGKLYTPDSLRLLVVTDREAELLLEADLPVVAKFGQRHGQKLD